MVYLHHPSIITAEQGSLFWHTSFLLFSPIYGIFAQGLIHALIQCLLIDPYYMPGTVVGTEDTVLNNQLSL